MAEHNNMLAFWILLLLPFAVQGNCGSRPPSQARIVGGTGASVNSWPWQAMLLDYLNGTLYAATCGGTLIDPSWVITAAHCVVGRSPSSFIVRMGAHYRVNGTVGTEQDITVAQIIVHENYTSPFNYSNDIALMKLTTSVSLSVGVAPACLPDVNQTLINKTCWITGWGALSFRGGQPSSLMQAAVPLVSKEICLQAYPNGLEDTMLCAGYAQGGVDACQGDSGGPLVCEFSGKWYLEGVTSWGQRCGDPNSYGVYVKVRVFMSWINAKIISNSGPVTASTTSATHFAGTTVGSLQSISASTNHLPAVTPSAKQSVSSTMAFPVVSLSTLNRGVPNPNPSSVSPSVEQPSISASLFPNALLMLNMFLMGNLHRMLFF